VEKDDAVVAVFATHAEADTAIKRLAGDGFAMKHLSLIGKGCHSEETVSGFHNIGDRVKFWGSRGAFWGGMWGLFFGGLFLTIPIVGHVIVLGYLAAAAVSAVEGAVVVGGVSAIGAVIASIGIPKDSVMKYETTIRADDFVVMAHGNPGEVEWARAVLGNMYPKHLEMHSRAAAEAAALEPASV
jgi:hypothetical protein